VGFVVALEFFLDWIEETLALVERIVELVKAIAEFEAADEHFEAVDVVGIGVVATFCSYDDFKTNVLSRLRQSIGLRARTSHEYEQMFRELSIRIGFANMQNKRVAVFSLKKHAVLQLGFPPRLCIAVEDVVPFLDACADAAVDMYPISQNARFERSVSSISNIVQKQERTVQRLKEKMKHCGQSSGESAGNQSTDIEMAQKLYDDLKQKLEETEKLRGTVPYKIKVIKRAAEESCHVME